MKNILAPAILVSLAFVSVPAFADKAAYCKAYARDFADQSAAADETQWQHKYQIAQTACLAKPAPPKPLIYLPVRKPAPTAKPATVVKTIVVPDTAPVAGTPEWNDYCAKKYTSFNSKTGTYMSLTGVERKCLYTK